MSGDTRTGADNPFSPRAALGLVLFGGVVFVLLLWMIGAGMTSESANDGGGHAAGKGLNGYAALAGYLERRGYPVRLIRNEGGLDDPGLLVLTPPAHADGAAIDKIVSARRRIGPTLVIAPKWMTTGLSKENPGAKKGWVTIVGTGPPEWKGFLDIVGVSLAPLPKITKQADWSGAGLAGILPDRSHVLSGTGAALRPLVMGKADGRILAAYIADSGHYPALEEMSLDGPDQYGDDEGLYPLVVVFEPDLLDNYGFARRESAVLAERLIAASGDSTDGAVNFDLTLNGLARSANLLTLAFTPPFLAATLCLLLAAIVVGWRAFQRFGPARRGAPAIAYGKRALVSNAAGLIRRARRLHLVAAPYADGARERLARALALPRSADPALTEAAIDRALRSRRIEGRDFSAMAATLRSARREGDLVRAAQELHSLERTLIR